MGEIVLPGRLYAETEFQNGLNGTCGPNALAMSEATLVQSLSGHRTLDVYNRMRAAGRCAANGASDIWQLHDQAAADGFVIADILGYQDGNATPWPWAKVQSYLDKYADGQTAVILETSAGQAYVDFLTGKGENAVNLQYHFTATFGKNTGGGSALTARQLPPGRWTADGDNYVNSGIVNGGGSLCYYPDTVVQAVRACALLAIRAKGGSKTVWTFQFNGSTVTGADDGNGHHANQGFAYLIHQKYPNTIARTGEVYYRGDRAYMLLSNGVVLSYVAGDPNPIADDRPATVVADLEAAHAAQVKDLGQQLSDANTKVGNLSGQLSEATHAVAQLTTQLQAATETIAQLRQQGGDPEARAALVALKAVLDKLP